MNFIQKKGIKYFCCLVLQIILLQTIGATEERYVQTIPVTNSATVLNSDPLFPASPLPTWATSANIANQTVTNQIVFRLDPNNTTFQACNFTATVDLSISYMDAAGTNLSQSTSLTIEYNNDRGVTHQDQDYFIFTNGHRVTVVVTNVTVNYTPNTCSGIPNNLVIDNIIEIERYYDFNPTAIGSFVNCAPSPTYITSSNDAELIWNPISGAEFYDLEWLHINDYDGVGGALTPSVLAFDFRNNATRIQTSKQRYSIPVVYDQGYLIFRYRGIGIGGNNFDVPILGAWTISDGEKNNPTNFCHLKIGPTGTVPIHEGDSLNWQYIANFAEEGKNKISTSYFDGSLRNRQVVSRLNTENQTIVGETIFDYQGRGAIQVLPTPTKKQRVQYYELYNRPLNDNNRNYDQRDFDKDDATQNCDASAKGMSPFVASTGSTGSSNYYSDQNSDQNEHQAYVPKAENYPFTQIEYTPDNTGRIRRQSGVGPTHKLGTGHETKYFYGKPMQEHLDRLFGSEVGYFSHYKKNMVIDANGQISVSYLDQQGRVIATSLAGNAPQNLRPLDSNKEGSPDQFKANILDNKPLIPGDNQLFSSFSYLATTAGDHTFNYDLIGEKFQPKCPVDICYDCVYDLIISIKDDCGEEMIPGGAIRETIGPLNNLDEFCSTIDSLNKNFIVYLEVGNYAIHKTLTINEEALQYYWEDYLNREGCVIPLDDFIDEEMSQIDFSQCEPANNCSEICEQLLDSGATQAEIDACKQECEMADPCEGGLMAMMADFYPGGQYALFEDDINATSPLPAFEATDCYSILNTYSTNNPCGAGGLYFYQSGNGITGYNDPQIEYKDENDNLIYITLSDGSIKKPNELTLEEFVLNFDPVWAESLIEYHPEYCDYLWCSGPMRTSDVYDHLMESTETYEEALNLNLLNPLNENSAPTSPGNPDPFFDSGGLGANVKNDMLAFMDIYPVSFPSGNTVNYNLWEIAAIAVICNAPNVGAPELCADGVVTAINFEPFTSNNPCSPDRIWKIFRGLYLGEKQRLADNLKLCAAPPSGKEERFPTFQSAMGNAGFSQVYGDPNILADDLTQVVNDSISEICSDQCEAYADQWMNQLSGCNTSINVWVTGNTTYDQLREKLIEICIMGCDAGNPLGATSVPPDSSGVAPINSGSNYFNFTDAIIDIIGPTTLDCNADLINMPGSYEHEHPSMAAGSNMDDCACDKILNAERIYQQYLNGPGLSPGISDLSAVFNMLFGETVDELNRKACLCDLAFLEGQTAPAQAWPGNEIWTPAAIDYLAQSGEYVPQSLTCADCFTCEEIQAQFNAYTNSIVSQYYAGQSIPDSMAGQVHGMTTTHLNEYFNLDLTYWDYEDFLAECDQSQAADLYCGDITTEALDLENLLFHLAIQQSDGVTELLDTACLCIPPYGNPPTDPNLPVTPFNVTDYFDFWDTPPFTNSLIDHIDPNYDFTSTSCDHLYVFDEIIGDTLYGNITSPGGNGTDCALTLSFIDPGFDFDHIIEFFNIRPDPDFLTVGTNTHFLIDVSITFGGNVVVTTLQGNTDCFPIVECNDDSKYLTLCNPTSPQPPLNDPCIDNLINIAILNATTAYGSYIEQAKEEFRQAYISKCFEAAATETFNMEFADNEYHYTLYYYDQAGNLIQTVPPEGVEFLTDPTCVSQAAGDRATAGENRELFTKHRMATKYNYNSLNQLVEQHVPDHDDFNDWRLNTVSIPTGLEIHDIDFATDNKGYFVATKLGSNPLKGVIYQTNDAGTSWQELGAGAINPGDLEAAQFVNASVGYAVGENGMLIKTLDGGANWCLIYTGAVQKLVGLYVRSSNSDEILVFDQSGNIFHSANAGGNWLPGVPGNLSTINGIGKLNEVQFADDFIGYALGENNGQATIYKTIDGGSNWIPQNNFQALNLNGVQFISQNLAYAIGENGTLLKTIDAGANWIDIATGITANLKDLYFESNGNGILLTTNGKIHQTLDGGLTWNQDPTFGIFRDINYFPSQSQIYLLDEEGNTHSKANVNSTWNSILKPTLVGYNGFQTIAFDNQTAELYIAGNLGKVYKRNISAGPWTAIPAGLISFQELHVNNGKALARIATGGLLFTANISTNIWSAPIGVSGSFSDFHMEGSTGYALKVNGEIIKSIDDGENWNPLTNDPASLGTIPVQKGIASFNANLFSVGGDGSIYSTQDEGATTWTTQSNNYIPLPLNDLDVLSSNEIFTVGNNGTILKTSDGGNAWNSIFSFTAEDLQAVAFLNSAEGAVGGDNGIYQETTNGSFWTTLPTTSNTINDIHISSNNYFILSQDAGELAHKLGLGGSWTTAQAGTDNLIGLTSFGNKVLTVGSNGTIWNALVPAFNWTQSSSIETEPLFALDFTDGNIGYAVGLDGITLKTNDDGDNWMPQASATTNTLKDVAFKSNSTGVIIGEAMTLNSTNSGGTSWSPATISGTTNQENLNGVAISDNGNVAFAVGDNGKILSTSNLSNWSVLAAVAGIGNKNLNAIDLVDIVGYIVGDDGMILKSENCLAPFSNWITQQADNNEDWATFTTGQNAKLQDIQFVDRATGYGVGENGTILKTITGGTYWTSRNSNTSTRINKVHLQNENQGFFGGDASYLSKLEDNTDQYSTRFWYDKLGRLVASQNSKQFAMSPPRYSYTDYDDLGRIIEVGELASVVAPNETLVNDNSYPENWNANRTEVTRTQYDILFLPFINAQFGPLGQEYLRNRVASVFYYDEFSLSTEVDYRFASHYSYDIHGNVKVLINENRDLVHLQQQFKRIEYNYDLVSGNVNEVHYQPGECDQFFHKYHYDADNRIDSVWTSSDAIQWDKDARYTYYQHGPLARVELGDLQVQGMDYAYTIQGWIKGVNSNSLEAAKDIGKDGQSSSTNQLVARDAYGFSLNYFDNEYNSIDPTAQNFLATVTGTPMGNASPNLYNGNISKMVTSLTDIAGNQLDVQGMSYQYDQLNRLVDAAAFASPNVANNNSFAGVTDNGDYHTEYSYDANGNIETLLRNGVTPVQQMDDMRYRYTEHGSEKINNRLNHVNDPIAATNYPNTNAPDTEDINDQGNYDPSHPFDWNYDYDEIGNLTQDKAEEIDRIEWTVYGKVKKVIRTTNNHDKADLEFAYDPSGNRIIKLVKPRQAGVLQSQDKWTYTYYARDASGNIMATYKRKLSAAGAVPSIVVTDSLWIGDHHLYGSSRLGVEAQDLLLADLSFNSTGLNGEGIYSTGSIIASNFGCTPENIHRVLGKKQFELSNHLGNVLATISDRKIAKGQGSSFSYFDSNVEQYNDYYAFGMLMPGRNDGGYRFGFNGMERDDEVKGGGNSLDFGDRMYDGRLGRWSVVEPLFAKYPNFSSYLFAGNMPIFAVDVDGQEIVIYYKTETEKIVKVTWVEAMEANTGNSFADDAIKTLNYLKASKVGEEGVFRDVIGDLASSDDYEIAIQYTSTNANAAFAPNDVMTSRGLKTQGGTVFWNPKEASSFEAEDGSTGVHSPALILFHELGESFIQNEQLTWSEAADLQMDKNSKFGDKLEEKNIIENENPATKTLRLKQRKSHKGGSFFFVKDPTSTEKLGPPDGTIPYNQKPSSQDEDVDENCFIKGTKVLLNSVEEINIENIKQGDSILVFKFENLQFVKAKIMEVSSPLHKDIVKIQFSDNTKNQNTFDHSYYTKEKGWASYKPEWTKERYGLDAKQLKVGDTVFKNENGVLKEVTITSIEENIGEVQTYNIIAEGDHNNYFANGILVHNEKVDTTVVKPTAQHLDKKPVRLNYNFGGGSNRLKLLLPSLLSFPKFSSVAPLPMVDSYEADVVSYSDYYAFGMGMVGRNGGGYRFGFQGQELDDEAKGLGNSIKFKYRIHDPRLGRFFSVDPLASEYPHNSSYAFSENRVNDAVEIEGLEAKLIITDNKTGFALQTVYGEKGRPNSTMIVVPTYEMKLVDAQDPTKVIATYNVTRDAWYSRGKDSDGNFALVNRAFEPSDGDKNLYGSNVKPYPSTTKNEEAFELTRFGDKKLKAMPFSKEQNTYLDGSLIDDARTDETREVATSVMVHIGGYYHNSSENKNKLAGSYGCFGIIPPSQTYSLKEHAQKILKDGKPEINGTSNKDYHSFVKNVISTRESYRGTENFKVIISVEKRSTLSKTKTVNNESQDVEE